MAHQHRTNQFGNISKPNPSRLIQTAIFLLSMFGVQMAFAHGLSASDQASMISGGYFQFIKLGASHMLTGYDHLLFLLGVVFFLDKFKDITKFITAFTVGHSITLIFATFMGITANYYLIDAAIALTVVYKGFDNLGGFQKYFKMDSPNLIVLVFVFGLVHGFGLSTRLQQLPLGDDGLLLKILSFNLGVEVGQIVALTVMLLVLKTWRHRESFSRFSTVTNFGLVLAGLLLFSYQMSGFAGTLNYGQDPLQSGPPADVSHADRIDREDTLTITIPANSSLEYKLELEKGAVLEYSWESDGSKLYYDFHGDMKYGKPGDFQSFETATENQSAGELSTPFAGAIGWYWKNQTREPVEIILKTNGDYEIIGII